MFNTMPEPKKLLRYGRTAWHSIVGNSWRSNLSKELHGSEYQDFLSSIIDEDVINLNSFEYKILTSRILQEEAINQRNFPLLETLNNNLLGNFDGVCIDIGSGTGWIANILSERFTKVIAIEPNSNAIEIAKRFFGNGSKENIVWRCGYAEKVLRELEKFDSPVFVVTGVVLSHLPNKVVREILAEINKGLPVGSSGVLCEAWGSARTEKMWHVRTQKWWEKHLPNCELDFYGDERPDFSGEYLGIKFKKIFNS